MTSLEKWIRKRFGAHVEDGIGRWSDKPESTTLGRAIYEYSDSQMAVTLYDRGLACLRGGKEQQWAFSEITEVGVLPLTELVKVHQKPAHIVEIVLTTERGRDVLAVPMELYSELAPTLCGAVERSAR